jgi:hypothetical protein
MGPDRKIVALMLSSLTSRPMLFKDRFRDRHASLLTEITTLLAYKS